MAPFVRRGTQVALALLLMAAGPDPTTAQNQCASGTYTYTFTNSCAETIFVGQNNGGTTSTPPSFPEAGNWALAPACTVSNQASVCTGPGSTCSVQAEQTLGQCTCTADSDCPGSAPCSGKLCSTTTTFCTPQTWTSGVFWARTGCTLANGELTCATGQCGGNPGVSGGQIDCGAGATQFGPSLPAGLFEVTSSTGSVNYDVSLNSGYNVQLSAAPVGGGYVFPLTAVAATCPTVGCVADLNATCPRNLQADGGCLDPCTQCTQNAPAIAGANAQIYAALMCNQTITADFSGNTPVNTTACSGTVTGGLPTYQDMYCAKNLEGDGNAQASVNQGTPTAFSQNDCFPGTTFVIPTFPAGYTPPAGQGVCLYESDTPGVNNFQWAGPTGAIMNCGILPDGSPCGGYVSQAANYPNALGYTCRTVTVQSQSTHLCLPPTTSGLGVCAVDSTGKNPPLYAGVGGTFNAAWLTAGLQAATASTVSPYTPGTTPYYQTFKTACPAAYTWQYDDAASGFACTVANTVPPAGTFTGFNVAFCAPAAAPVPAERTGVSFLSAEARGAGGTLGRDQVEVSGYFFPKGSIDLRQETVSLDAALTERGSELVSGFGVGQRPLPVRLFVKPEASPDKATFETPPGITPHARMSIEKKPLQGGHAFSLIVDQISIQRARACGPWPGPNDKVSLATQFTLEAAAIVVSADARWKCRDGAVYRVGR